jgi:hypothetical protein
MVLPRKAHTATLLPNGQVLLTGGDPCFEFSTLHGPDGDPCPLEETELYDPASGTFVSTGNMFFKRALHTATLLPSGKVLIVGGGNANAELYEPATGAFALTGSMSVDRSTHTATLLSDGRVLITGGANSGAVLATAEIYDPQAGTFSSTGGSGMTTPRISHTATRLENGKVLISGGLDSNDEPLLTAEVYDPVTASFTSTGSMHHHRSRHTATLLGNGTVLIAAGFGFGIGQFASAEIYDPASGTFTDTDSMRTGERDNHFASVLPSGKVLISGGDDSVTFNLSGQAAELYEPATGTFSQTGGMQAGRVRAAAVTLLDGRVLVTGGGDLPSAEVYE